MFFGLKWLHLVSLLGAIWGGTFFIFFYKNEKQEIFFGGGRINTWKNNQNYEKEKWNRLLVFSSRTEATVRRKIVIIYWSEAYPEALNIAWSNQKPWNWWEKKGIEIREENNRSIKHEGGEWGIKLASIEQEKSSMCIGVHDWIISINKPEWKVTRMWRSFEYESYRDTKVSHTWHRCVMSAARRCLERVTNVTWVDKYVTRRCQDCVTRVTRMD